MTDDWYTADGAHLLKAEKMATFRHGDLKLETADVHGIDEYIMGRLYEPGEVIEPTGATATYLGKYRVSGYALGLWTERLKFQSGQLLYPAMGKCTTTDDDPVANFYTHTMALRTAQPPLNMGRHWERENEVAAEDEEIDILGMGLYSYHASCSEAFPVAIQELNWGVAKTLNTDAATDDLTAIELTDEPFKWNHFSFPTFTYGGETIEADIIGWAFDVQNTVVPVGLDSGGLYTKIKYIPLSYISTTLQIYPSGRNSFELIRTALASYATDLDLVVKAIRTADRDQIVWTHDKLYCNKYNIEAHKSPGGVESYFMRMSQLNTGSIVPVVIDDYVDNNYET